jgi:hypothetical protein
MTVALNFCALDGTLVSGEDWLPAERFDFDWGASKPTIGCNQLACDDCDERVRSGLGFDVADRRAFDPIRAFEAPDWTALPFLERDPDGKGRLYVCRCRFWVEHALTPLGAPQLEGLPGLPHDWVCAGHPYLPLPARLDGAAIDRGSDFAALARETLRAPRERLPTGLPAGRDPWPAFWMARLYRLLEPHRLHEAVSRAVAACLDAPEPEARSGALDFFFHVRDAPGAERVALLARDRRDLYAGRRDPFRPAGDLDRALFRTLQNRLNVLDEDGRPADRTALEVARAQMLRGGIGDLVYQMGMRDAAWLCEHAAAIVAAAPEALDELIYNLREQPLDRLLPTVLALAALPSVSREALRSRIARSMPPPTQRPLLAALEP